MHHRKRCAEGLLQRRQRDVGAAGAQGGKQGGQGQGGQRPAWVGGGGGQRGAMCLHGGLLGDLPPR
ncbi:hypothetical protein LP419_40280 [Massilia sp. H-1]|nr:hypothetical protein LP419_40280 [Massilia sp. H-1]